jgi:hypothetical protein
MEGEVECAEIFGPPSLSPRECFRAGEVFEVFVVCENFDGGAGAF